MKILYVCRLYSGFEESFKTGVWAPKGAPTIARMISHLDKSEHDFSIILTPKTDDNSVKAGTYHLKGLKIPIRVLRGKDSLSIKLWKFREKISDLRQLFKIYKAVKKSKPDLVYCDRVNSFPAAVLARFTNTKIIWRVMGVLEDMHKASSSKSMRASFKRILWRSPFESVICTLDGSGGGPWMHKNLRKDVPRHLLLNGIEKDMGPIAIEALPKKGTKMLFVGRLESLKGIEEFMSAFYAASKDIPDLHAVIAGDGSLKDTLEKEAHDKGYETRVHFLGSVKPQELKYVRQACDFYVSLNKQGNLSNVNLEALSDHLPVIVPSSREEFGIDKDTDHFIPQDVFYRFGHVGDEAALVAAIKFMADKDNLSNFKKNAKECSDKILPSWDERIAQEMRIFEEAANRKPYDKALVIADLGSGGAQKVLRSLAHDLEERGERVAVITLAGADDDFVTLPPATNHIALVLNQNSGNALKGILANFQRIRAIRSALKRLSPKTTISFITPTNVLTIFAALGLKTQVIISERNDPARQSFGKFWDTLRKLTYRFADKVSANSPNAIDSLKAYVSEKKLVLVPNALSAPNAQYLRPYEKKEKSILIVGRLHEQKAHHVLLSAFAQIHKDFKDWKLEIVGDGPLRARLEKQAQDLNISDSVFFEGVTDNPYAYYARASIFVLPSLHEGTPNALLEAMSCGIAPIISDACEGAFPFIDNDKSGIIFPVGDTNALAAALKELMSNKDKRKELAEQAYKNVEPLFTQTTADLWSEALKT